MTARANIVILYGSQTGNAEDMARRIGYKAKKNGYSTLVEAMDDYPLKQLTRQKIVLFVCSTTGHGQEPENMKNFYKFMRRKDLPTNSLTNLNYAVFGLGNSSYSKFNWVSKVLFKRLKECGANPLQDLTAGDEQHPYGCDGAIYSQLELLWPIVECLISVRGDRVKQQELNGATLDDYLPDNSYEVELDEYPSISLASLKPRSVFNSEFVSRRNIKTAYCILNQRLTAKSHFQDTRFFRFKLDEEIEFEPGDTCSIFPANSDESVAKFAELIGLNLDRKIRRVTKKDPNYMMNYLYDFIPENLTVGDLIKHYFDIQSIPKRSFFEFLWPFSDNELEREKLREFASTEGQEELYEYCILPKRTILEALMDFPNTVKQIKFNYLLDMIPPIKPRSFSIASAQNVHPEELHFLIGVVKYKTKMKKPRMGLCSNYLANLNAAEESNDNSRIIFFLQQTTFKLPKHNWPPIIMIGPGLGVAPFISFMQYAIEEKSHGNNYLYFGCRGKSSDFYFDDTWKRYENSGMLRMRVAFSREGEKKHVQDLIEEDLLLVNEKLNEGAYIYIAGNSKLPEDLRKLLAKILSHSYLDVEKKISQLEGENRIQYDCW